MPDKKSLFDVLTEIEEASFRIGRLLDILSIYDDILPCLSPDNVHEEPCAADLKIRRLKLFCSQIHDILPIIHEENESVDALISSAYKINAKLKGGPEK